jgi:hypothetical protein
MEPPFAVPQFTYFSYLNFSFIDPKDAFSVTKIHCSLQRILKWGFHCISISKLYFLKLKRCWKCKHGSTDLPEDWVTSKLMYILCAIQFNTEALAVSYHFQGILQKQLGIHKKNKSDIFKCDKFERCAAKLPPAMRLKFHIIQYLVYSLHCTEYSVEINLKKN